jgi:N-acyl-D-aspartate/D-glutamate deacylase
MFSPAFTEVLAEAPERRHLVFSDEAFRARMRASTTPDAARVEHVTVEETSHQQVTAGTTIGDLARHRRTTPLDAMIDLALDEQLQTRFKIVLHNDDEAELAQLLNDPRCLLSLSDAGAHQTQICDAVYPTYLLGHWVRDRQALTLEKAIWRLTRHPASVFGLHDRGVIQTGAIADLVAFDPDTVGSEPLQRVYDLPAGNDRLIGRATGIVDVWVNGTRIIKDGRDTDSAPGQVVRSSSYDATPV